LLGLDRAIVYTLQRDKAASGYGSTLDLSLGFTVASLVVLYLSFAYNNTYFPDPASAMRNTKKMICAAGREIDRDMTMAKPSLMLPL